MRGTKLVGERNDSYEGVRSEGLEEQRRGWLQRKLKNGLILKVVIISILPGFGNNYSYLL